MKKITSPNLKKNKMKQKINWFMNKYMVLAFSLCWMLIVFKGLHIGYMQNVPWYTVFLPLLAFLLTSLSYIILTYFYNTVFLMVKPPKLTHKQNRIVERRVKIAKEETRITKTLRKITIFIISILIAYLILWH
jgi:hypothetical protein